jgi:hypothetical protein
MTNVAVPFAVAAVAALAVAAKGSFSSSVTVPPDGTMGRPPEIDLVPVTMSPVKGSYDHAVRDEPK